jgi:hypothetical protein
MKRKPFNPMNLFNDKWWASLTIEQLEELKKRCKEVQEKIKTNNVSTTS